MAGDLRLRHREAHIGKEAPLLALADVALGLGVGDGGRRPHGVDSELLGGPLQLGCGHGGSVPVAVRTHASAPSRRA